MTVRGIIDATRAALSPASQTSHVRFGPGFIKEYQPGRVQLDLSLLPVLAGLFYVGTVLLRRS